MSANMMMKSQQRLQQIARALGAVAALWALGLGASPAAAKGSVVMEASVGAGEVYPLDIINYKLEIVRTEGAGEVYPDLPDFGEFKVREASGPSNAVYFASINGVSTTKNIDTYIYSLQAPAKPGIYTISPATADFEGKKIRTKSVMVKVEEATVHAAGIFKDAPEPRTQPRQRHIDKIARGRVYLIPQVSASECYIRGEVKVSWSLYVAESLLREFNFIENRVGNVGFHAAPGLDEIRNRFFIHVMRDWDRQITARKEEIEGEKYLVYPLRELLIFPQTLDSNAIPPFRVAFELPDRNRANAFFSLVNTYQLVITAPEPPLTVKELPLTGKPKDFTGAVGMVSLVATSTAPAGKIRQLDDLFAVNVKLRGRGYLEYFPAPKLASDKDFTIFATEEGDSSQQVVDGHLTGEKSWKFMLRAENHGKLEIPPFEFSYFNPETEQYEVARSEAIPIQVEENKELTEVRRQTRVADQAIAPPDPIAGKLKDDLAYISDASWGSLTLVSDDRWLVREMAPWSLLGAAGLFLMTFAARPAQPRDAAKTRRSKAARKAQTALDALSGASKLSDEEFGAQLATALKGYLADIDNRPIEGLSPNYARELVAQRTESASLAEDWFNLLEEAASLRYVGGAIDRDALATKGRDLVKQTEEGAARAS
jgi:hypothetical protein